MVVNQKAVHSYILERTRALRPAWPCRRVSANAIELIDRRVCAMIDRMVQSHPSIGKTFLGE